MFCRLQYVYVIQLNSIVTCIAHCWYLKNALGQDVNRLSTFNGLNFITENVWAGTILPSSTVLNNRVSVKCVLRDNAILLLPISIHL